MQQGIGNRILIYLNGLRLRLLLVLQLIFLLLIILPDFLLIFLFVFLFIFLRKRQSEGVAEGCHHQPSHQKIKDSLPLHKVTGFASA